MGEQMTWMTNIPQVDGFNLIVTIFSQKKTIEEVSNRNNETDDICFKTRLAEDWKIFYLKCFVQEEQLFCFKATHSKHLVHLFGILFFLHRLIQRCVDASKLNGYLSTIDFSERFIMLINEKNFYLVFFYVTTGKRKRNLLIVIVNQQIMPHYDANPTAIQVSKVPKLSWNYGPTRFVRLCKVFQFPVLNVAHFLSPVFWFGTFRNHHRLSCHNRLKNH